MKEKLDEILDLIPLVLIFLVLTLFFVKYYKPVISFLRSSLETQPYLISFLSGFFSTISILVPFYTTYPSYAIMLTLLTGSFGNIALVMVLMGTGAALGDLLSYFVTYFPTSSLVSEERIKKAGESIDGKFDSLKAKITNPLEKHLGIKFKETWHLDFFLAFVFGFLPLPDDILMLYFGFRRRRFKPILIGSILGKILMLLAIYLGLFSFSYFFIGGKLIT